MQKVVQNPGAVNSLNAPADPFGVTLGALVHKWYIHHHTPALEGACPSVWRTDALVMLQHIWRQLSWSPARIPWQQQVMCNTGHHMGANLGWFWQFCLPELSSPLNALFISFRYSGMGARRDSLERRTTGYFSRMEAGSELKMNKTAMFTGKKSKYPVQETHWARELEMLT